MACKTQVLLLRDDDTTYCPQQPVSWYHEPDWLLSSLPKGCGRSHMQAQIPAKPWKEQNAQ